MAQSLKHLGGEMLASCRPKVYTCERALHGKYVRHVLQLLVQGNSCSGFFGLLDTESGVVIAEVLIHLAEDKWENSTLSRIVLIVAAIHEDILLARVAMKITE